MRTHSYTHTLTTMHTCTRTQKHITHICKHFLFPCSMWEMWTRQDPWQDLRAPFAMRVERCLQRNERPPIPHDMPAPLRELITACWQKNAHHRPTARDILTIYLPHLETYIQPKNTLALSISAQRKKGGSMLVAPVTPRSSPALAPTLPSATLTSAGDLVQFTRTKSVSVPIIPTADSPRELPCLPHSLSSDLARTSTAPAIPRSPAGWVGPSQLADAPAPKRAFIPRVATPFYPSTRVSCPDVVITPPSSSIPAPANAQSNTCAQKGTPSKQTSSFIAAMDYLKEIAAVR